MIKYIKLIQLPCLLLSFLATNPVEAAWTEPRLISSENADLVLDMDKKGNTLAIWNNALGTSANNLYYSYLNKDRGWFVPLPLSDTNGRALMFAPSMAIDANSNIVAVWEERDFTDKNNICIVKAATHPTPGQWSIIDLAFTKIVGQPQVAISPSGYAVAVWEKEEGESNSQGIIQASTLQFGGEWSAPIDISTGKTPKVVVDNAGNAVVIWFDHSFKSASLPFGGSWSSPTSISTEGDLVTNSLTVAMNPSGNTIAAWIKYSDYSQVINAATLSFGGSWSKAIEVHFPSENYFIRNLDIVIGNAGNATLVWQEEVLDNSTFPMVVDTSIQSSMFLNKDKWTKPVRISPEGVFCVNPKIALDGTGKAYAVWNNDKSIQLATRPLAGKWSSATDLSTDGVNTNPLIAVDSSGYSVIAWLNSFGGIQAVSGTP